MYCLIPEKPQRLVYGTFYLAIGNTFYETVNIVSGFNLKNQKNTPAGLQFMKALKNQHTESRQDRRSPGQKNYIAEPALKPPVNGRSLLQSEQLDKAARPFRYFGLNYQNGTLSTGNQEIYHPCKDLSSALNDDSCITSEKVGCA